MVTDGGAPLFVNVAVWLGTVSGVGVEVQFVPTVHSALVEPVQVPSMSMACAASGVSVASAPSQTLPSSAARLRAGRAAGAGARVACERHRYERIPQPLRAAPAAHPNKSSAPSRANEQSPRGQTLRVEPVTINSRSSASARIAAACGFSATLAPPGHRLGLRPGTPQK